ncbi:MAG: L-asparaginase 1 [Gammaproteobacteria bacterium]|nr:L-asparaginase 1 [Gammaproteobacteria bacterium]
MTAKKILIINTGGTISSVRTAHGFSPKQGHLEEVLPKILGLSHPEMPTYDIHEYQPLLDSSNMTLAQWNVIAQDIWENYPYYDGFVVLHGTDTMAYTASALSFMLENLAKAVILTGSQIPLSEARNDAVDNLVTSLWLCANTEIKEVCIYFDNQLLRGNRARKVSAESMSAFASPNYPNLAEIGIHIQIHQEYCLASPNAAFNLQKLSAHFIANFRLFPGFSSEVLKFLLEQPVKGLVLETFGAGNAQSNDPSFLNMLRQASEKGVVMVNCTQCLHGKVEMSQYETGFRLQEAGLVSGYDMTPEAAHCKLLYLLSKYDDVRFIKEQMMLNLRGEMSP